MDAVSMVMSYRGIACWKPGEIFNIEFNFFFKDTIIPNPEKASVVSIFFPCDQIIKIYKITIFIKVEIVVVILKVNILQFLKKLQSKGENGN